MSPSWGSWQERAQAPRTALPEPLGDRLSSGSDPSPAPAPPGRAKAAASLATCSRPSSSPRRSQQPRSFERSPQPPEHLLLLGARRPRELGSPPSTCVHYLGRLPRKAGVKASFSASRVASSSARLLSTRPAAPRGRPPGAHSLSQGQAAGVVQVGVQATFSAQQLGARLAQEAQGLPWVLGTLGRLALPGPPLSYHPAS